MVRLKRIPGETTNVVLAKLEGNNPGGSVKDRAAYGMIKGAMDRGELKPGMKLIEATSGNTGIALAMIAALFGVEIELVMPEDATRERVASMQAFGAKVILTPKEKSMEGSIDYANGQLQKGGYVMLNQFADPDNPLMHYRTTGPEIWRDTNGGITHFVSAMGTTGTIMVVSAFLKEKTGNSDHRPPAERVLVIAGIRKWPAAYLPRSTCKTVDRGIEVSQTDARYHAPLAAKRNLRRGIPRQPRGRPSRFAKVENAVIVTIVMTGAIATFPLAYLDKLEAGWSRRRLSAKI